MNVRNKIKSEQKKNERNIILGGREIFKRIYNTIFLSHIALVYVVLITNSSVICIVIGLVEQKEI